MDSVLGLWRGKRESAEEGRKGSSRGREDEGRGREGRKCKNIRIERKNCKSYGKGIHEIGSKKKGILRK